MARRIHPSLLEEPLFWGVPRSLLAQELLLVVLPLQLGFTWRTISAALFWALVVHSALRFFHSRDPQAFEVLVDLRNYRRHYRPQSAVPAPALGARPWGSIPRPMNLPWHRRRTGVISSVASSFTPTRSPRRFETALSSIAVVVTGPTWATPPTTSSASTSVLASPST